MRSEIGIIAAREPPNNSLGITLIQQALDGFRFVMVIDYKGVLWLDNEISMVASFDALSLKLIHMGELLV